MSLMPSQISKSVDFTKTQKYVYLENKVLFFLQMKKFINYTSKTMSKNSLVAEITLNAALVVLTMR